MLPPINEAGFSRAHASPVGARVRARAGRRSGARARQRPQGSHRRRRRQGLREGRAGGRAARGRRGAGGAALPQVPAVDFAQFGPVESQAAGAHPEDLRAAPARQLGQPAARHAVRRGRHHRARGSARKLKDKADGAGVKLTPLAFVMRACVAGAAASSRTSMPRSMPSGENLVVQEVLAPRLRGRYAQRPAGAGDPRRRPQGRLRAGARAGRAVREGARRQAHRRPRCRAAASRSRAWAASAAPPSRPIINAPEVAILGVSRASHAAGLSGRRVRAAPDAAAVAVLRSSRHRRRRWRALHDHAGQDPRRAARRCSRRCREHVELRHAGPRQFQGRPGRRRAGATPATSSSSRAPLVTLETDKATMDVPASGGGRSRSAGEARRQGLAGLADRARRGAAAAAAGIGAHRGGRSGAPVATVRMPALRSVGRASVARSAEPSRVPRSVLVLGAGPGGYTAAFRAADLGLKVTLVERWHGSAACA